jgi:hypothetical protein
MHNKYWVPDRVLSTFSFYGKVSPQLLDFLETAMTCKPALVFAILLTPAVALGQEAKYAIKQATTAAPKELSEPVRKLFADKSLQLVGGNGAVVCELWLRKEVPVKATPEQIKNGLTYREVEESTILGAVRLDQEWTDYRKQKVKPGVYTLRLGFQPMDGDHMGTAPYSEFCLLVPAGVDQKSDLLEAKALREASTKAAGGSHPTVLLLFPNEKPADAPKLENKGDNTWVLMVKEPISVDGKPAPEGIGLGLTLIGQTSAP